MVDFARLLAADFRTFGEAATYAPVAGDPVAVTVIRRRPDLEVQAFQTTLVRPTTVLDVRVSEVADPAAGDVVTLTGSGESFKVQGRPERRDSLGLIWTLDTVPA
jgi:hypothetical protein